MGPWSNTMLNTPPSTLDGLKRHAKKLSKTLGIPLYQAQQQAAVFCGYPTFAVAQKSLAGNPPPGTARISSPKHRLYVSTWWTDRETGQSGREVWWIDLSAPFSELLTPSQMRLPGAFARLSLLGMRDRLGQDALGPVFHSAIRRWQFGRGIPRREAQCGPAD